MGGQTTSPNSSSVTTSEHRAESRETCRHRGKNHFKWPHIYNPFLFQIPHFCWQWYHASHGGNGWSYIIIISSRFYYYILFYIISSADPLATAPDAHTHPSTASPKNTVWRQFLCMCQEQTRNKKVSVCRQVGRWSKVSCSRVCKRNNLLTVVFPKTQPWKWWGKVFLPKQREKT